MKKILSLLLLALLSTYVTYSQSNATSNVNYYETQNFYGKTVSAFIGGAGAPVNGASSALVWVDMAKAPDGVVTGLTANGYTVTVATSATNFNTLLQSGSFNLAVLFTQGDAATALGVNLTAVSDYISGGGNMLFATWTDADEAFANLFEATFSGNTNLSTVTISDPILAAGITNPFTLTNAGWIIGFSIGMNPIGSGVVLATFENGDAAIIRGNGGRTMMLGYLSDAPPSAEREAILSNVVDGINGGGSVVPVPLFWVAILFMLIGFGAVYSRRKLILS